MCIFDSILIVWLCADRGHSDGFARWCEKRGVFKLCSCQDTNSVFHCAVLILWRIRKIVRTVLCCTLYSCKKCHHMSNSYRFYRELGLLIFGFWIRFWFLFVRVCLFFLTGSVCLSKSSFLLFFVLFLLAVVFGAVCCLERYVSRQLSCVSSVTLLIHSLAADLPAAADA